MPITIWKPAEYNEVFSRDVSGASQSAINGIYAAAPYDNDTKVCEIARFTGWKQLYYADTGEFEVVVSAGQVRPGQVKRNYLVNFDGDMFVIEDFEWNKTSEGYECVISGRDMGRYLDDEIIKGFLVGDSLNYWKVESEGKTSVRNINAFLRGFFRQTAAAGGAINWNSPVGWFRDTKRCETKNTFIRYDFTDEEATLAEEKGSKIVTDILSYGSTLRKLLAYFGIGYRWDVAPKAAGLATVALVLYDHGAGDVTMRADGRGVSNNSYYERYRGSCNAAHVDAVSAWATPANMHYRYRTGFDETGWWFDETNAEKNARFMQYSTSSYANWAEVAADWRERYIDLAKCPEENQATLEDFLAWVDTNSEDYRVPPEIGYSFSYDNSGAYKYGVHFSLGSTVTIQDDFLGITVTQRLTGVKETFVGGASKGYDFEFGDQSITRKNAISRKFVELNRKTYKTRTEE